ncbi:MAG: hypothetical protein M0C28_25630 [Candidatus Moduliflexus flocculans]|nr:hypothetical protein [Candidatus Moduliflexus flocculans]
MGKPPPEALRRLRDERSRAYPRGGPQAVPDPLLHLRPPRGDPGGRPGAGGIPPGLGLLPGPGPGLLPDPGDPGRR